MLREIRNGLFLTRATPGVCGRQKSNWLLFGVGRRWLLLGLLLAGLGNAVLLPGQTATTATNPAGAANPAADTKEERLAALHLELTNASNRVLAIVNQFVPAYRRVPGMSVSTYSPGWFHEGAAKPDFNTVDVRQSRDLQYAQHQYVTSDLNPGLVFRGQDLEFNSMTNVLLHQPRIAKT